MSLRAHGGGRPRDPVWQHFISLTIKGKEYGKCKKCGHKQMARAGRLKMHHAQCSVDQGFPRQTITSLLASPTPTKCQTAEVPMFSSPLATTQSQFVKSEVPITPKRDRSVSPPPAKCPAIVAEAFTSQSEVNSQNLSNSINIPTSMDLEIAKFFYACNIPFSVADHPQFKNVVNMLCPGYQPPQPEHVRGPLLDTVYDQLQLNLKEILDGKMATLVQDGWSNKSSDPMVASCLQVDGNSYYISSQPTESITNAGGNCTKTCQEIIALVKEKYNCTVVGVCTDNPQNIGSVRETLKEDDPDLFVYGCSAHWLNLLGQDLTYEIQEMDPSRDPKYIAEQLVPVVDAIDACQADGASIATACHEWISLLEAPSLQDTRLKTVMDRHFQQAILPEHLAAYLLNVNYSGEKLSPSQINTVHQFIISKDPSFITQLISFQAKSAPFLPAYFTQAALNMDPVTWWKGAKVTGVNADFVDLVLQLLQTPASSISSERIFLNMGQTHSKVGNKLGDETAAKLVFSYCMLGGVELDY